MWKLRIRKNFSASHQLRGHGGACEKLHGHNWRVIYTFHGQGLNQIGLLEDFRDVEACIGRLLDQVDHEHLNDLAAFETLNPSCENIAWYLFHETSKACEQVGLKLSLHEVEVFETDECSASFGMNT